jgi:hypothetical protein
MDPGADAVSLALTIRSRFVQAVHATVGSPVARFRAKRASSANHPGQSGSCCVCPTFLPAVLVGAGMPFDADPMRMSAAQLARPCRSPKLCAQPILTVALGATCSTASQPQSPGWVNSRIALGKSRIALHTSTCLSPRSLTGPTIRESGQFACGRQARCPIDLHRILPTIDSIIVRHDKIATGDPSVVNNSARSGGAGDRAAIRPRVEDASTNSDRGR